MITIQKINETTFEVTVEGRRTTTHRVTVETDYYDKLTGGKVKKARASSPPKYRHPENPSLTWSGRGRQPAWYKELVEAGTSEEDLLIRD